MKTVMYVYTETGRRAYETDDLIFLYLLRIDHPSLFQELAGKPMNAFTSSSSNSGSMVAVPRGMSLPQFLTREDYMNHILRYW